MKIALASVKFVNGDMGQNIKTIPQYMKKAKEKGADLICFGEAFRQGFDALNYDLIHDLQSAQSVDGTVFKDLCHYTKKIGIDLMLGFIEKKQDTLYSSYALIMEGIVSHVYRSAKKG